ncbi:hypothetical protein Vretifemale_12713, partial [Volvox reticuliferus]
TSMTNRYDIYNILFCLVDGIRTFSTSLQTTTIAAILMTLLLNQDQQQAGDASCAPIPRQRQQPILVTAETNVAVDNILDRLLRLVNDEKKKKQEGQRPQETRMVGETTAENADAATGAATAAATVPSLARAAASAAGGEGGERVDGSLGDVNRKLLKLQQTEIEDQLCGSRSSEEGMDCLLEGLGRKAGEVVRVGDSGSVSPHLRKYCLEAIQGVRTEFGYNSRAVRKILKGARLVFATCAGAGSPLLDGVDFPLVVVDEASQATEPTTLIPLTRGSRQAVLVGDHLQLGPMLRSREARAVGAGVPLFERLQHRASPLQPQPPGGGLEAGDSRQREPGLHPSNGGGGGGFGGGLESHMLDTQYRMHPEIAAFPAQHFYGGRLRNGANTPGGWAVSVCTHSCRRACNLSLMAASLAGWLDISPSSRLFVFPSVCLSAWLTRWIDVWLAGCLPACLPAYPADSHRALPSQVSRCQRR